MNMSPAVCIVHTTMRSSMCDVSFQQLARQARAAAEAAHGQRRRVLQQGQGELQEERPRLSGYHEPLQQVTVTAAAAAAAAAGYEDH